MKADIKGALDYLRSPQIKGVSTVFEHNGRRLTKSEAIAVLEYADTKGYKTTAELSNDEVETILNQSTPKGDDMVKAIADYIDEETSNRYNSYEMARKILSIIESAGSSPAPGPEDPSHPCSAESPG